MTGVPNVGDQPKAVELDDALTALAWADPSAAP
jgi:hypothetical protein